MNKYELYNFINELMGDLEFEYKGVHGTICPTSRYDFDVCYGDKDKKYTSIDDVMSDNIYNGKCLNEIASDLDIY